MFVDKLRSPKLMIPGIMAVGALTLSACGSSYNDQRGRGDAPVGEIHRGARQVWNNIDQHPNVAAFCIGKDGIYTNDHDNGAPVVVVPGDANCVPGGVLTDAPKQPTPTLK